MRARALVSARMKGVPGVTLGLLVALGLWGCHHGPKVYVTRAEVASAGIPKSGWCGLTSQTLRAHLLARLRAFPHFELVGPKLPGKKRTAPKQAARFEVLLVPIGPAGGKVTAAVILRRVKDGVGVRYQLGAQEAVPKGASAGVEKAAALRAVDSALDAARLRIDALGKPSADLLEDARSQDPRVRAFALRTLADRGNRAAIPGLVKALGTTDPFELRRTLGALVELKAKKAVPEMIDASRGKSLELRRELIYAIGQIGGEDARGYLGVVAVGADQAALRNAAHQALVELSARMATQKKGHEQ